MQATQVLKKPWGLKWRSSVWFVTLGVTTDLLVYSIIIPVLPFQLEHLGYKGISGLVGWLLFAYSAGLVISTLPIAIFSEHYNARKYPLLFGQFFLAASQVMLMEVPTYWLMVIARVIQGISSSVVWVVGLALLCDTAPEATVGKQLGLAMTGLSIGFLVGPPVGGALYNAFGFRGPFIFSIIVTAVDFVGRLLVIERKDAWPHGIDPAAVSEKPQAHTEAINEDVKDSKIPDNSSPSPFQEAVAAVTPTEHSEPVPVPETRLPLLKVVTTLLRSPRAMVTILITLIQGLVYSATEPSLPLHLQDVWHLAASKVGLIYMAIVIPSLISSPLAGWWSDRGGTEWVMMACFILSIPWWIVLIVQKSLALFIVAIAIQSFFTSGILSPVTAELAAVSRAHVGVGYAHVYGAFNLCYGIGSGLGPVVGGQIYDHVKRGWLAICLLAVGLFLLGSALTISFTGDRPLLSRIVTRYREGRLFKFRHRLANTMGCQVSASRTGNPNST
ncbi:unnamed protein product [Somion occarium]|uniref:Major facilitator superfamily (MFS) profile domain-containing protein n=1 Tax=Somion occarium TaxID=3059160 RepID=A0ABP1CLZ0_9APHY